MGGSGGGDGGSKWPFTPPRGIYSPPVVIDYHKEVRGFRVPDPKYLLPPNRYIWHRFGGAWGLEKDPLGQRWALSGLGRIGGGPGWIRKGSAMDRIGSGKARLWTGLDRKGSAMDRIGFGKDRLWTRSDPERVGNGPDRIIKGSAMDRIGSGKDRRWTGSDPGRISYGPEGLPQDLP
jgi:hypothetical protein